MGVCQYEFQFQNEYMDFLEKSIGNLLKIPIDKEVMNRIDIEEESFILWKKDNGNYMLFSADKDSYIYLLIVKCDKKYEAALRSILFELCDIIEEDYGENHRTEVKDVFFDLDNWSHRLEKKYGVFNKIDI